MRLLRFTSCFLLLQIGLTPYTQGDSTVYITSPYRTEPSPYFKFSILERGFPKDSLELAIEALDKTKRNSWSREDSLRFAQATLRIGNVNLSEHYFNRLEIDYDTESEFWWDHLMLHILTAEYSEGLRIINNDQPGVLQFSQIYFIQRIFVAKLEHSREPKNWYKNNSIFNWEIDSTIVYDKRSSEFKENILAPVLRMDAVLELTIRYVHQDDPIVSRSFFEMGKILEAYFSLSQAYIAYSVARQYNGRDKEILERLRGTKAKLLIKKYKIPNFRKYFPRIEDYRFDYEVLKEKILKAQQDSSELIKPELLRKAKKKDPPIRSDFIFLIGLGLMFLLVLFFVKSRRK